MAQVSSSASADARLLADIGGTNARFAWQSHAGAPIEETLVLPGADHATLADALRHYLRSVGRSAPAACSIAIANPVLGDRVTMTNHHWTFSIAELKAEIGLQRLVVVNDFTALALALPELQPQELRQVGGERAVPNSAIALIGPGTGLGVSGLVPDGSGGLVPLQGEGGHVTLAGRTSREKQVLDHLEAMYGHASAERAICGRGLVDIHGALQTLTAGGATALPATAAEIVAGALEGGDGLCRETIDLFCAFLGTAAGNLALTLGARGGVYIGGGIVPRLGTAFDRSPFRARFEAKGRFSTGYLAAIPVQVIVATQSPALLGAARALDRASG